MKVLARDGNNVLVWLPERGHIWLRYGQEVRVEKGGMPEVPAGFRPASWSWNKGALAAYRDGNSADSFHVLEYGDHWMIHVDESNPDAGIPEFVSHALTDALGIAVVFLMAGLALWAAASK